MNRVAEHSVMPADHLVPLIAEGVQEIPVGGEHRPVDGELDDSLRAVHGCHDRLQFGALPAAFGHVGRDLENALGAPLRVQHRVVGGLKIHGRPASRASGILAGVEFAVCQPAPEGGVGRGIDQFRGAEHAMMAADHVFQGIAHGGQERLVGPLHDAVRVELDHSLRSAESHPCRTASPELVIHADTFHFGEV